MSLTFQLKLRLESVQFELTYLHAMTATLWQFITWSRHIMCWNYMCIIMPTIPAEGQFQALPNYLLVTWAESPYSDCMVAQSKARTGLSHCGLLLLLCCHFVRYLSLSIYLFLTFIILIWLVKQFYFIFSYIFRQVAGQGENAVTEITACKT